MSKLTYQGPNGVRKDLSHAVGTPAASAVLLLDERELSDSVWRIEVLAQCSPGGMRRLGTVQTAANAVALMRRPGPRAVLLAGCPGAIGWHATIARIGGTTGARGTFMWSTSPELAGLIGVEPVHGWLEREQWYTGGDNVAGGGTDTVTVLEGTRVKAIHAWQSGDGGELVVNADPLGDFPGGTELPPDGSTTLSPDGHLWGPCTITLDLTGNAAGKGGYTVELVR